MLEKLIAIVVFFILLLTPIGNQTAYADIVVFIDNITPSPGGDIVTIKGFGAAVSQLVTITIFSPDDTEFEQLNIFSTGSGEFSTIWLAMPSTPPGIYTIEATDGFSTSETTVMIPPISESNFPITIVCTNPPNVQLCEPKFSTNVETESELMVKYTVTGHCSSVRVHVFLDGNFVTTSEFLSWVNTSPPSPFDELSLMTEIFDLGPVSSGTHLVSLQAEGQVSGCNTGGLGVWTGTLTTFTNTILPEPPLSCGPKTVSNANNQCIPNISQICGQGTFPDFDALMCFGVAMETIGGVLLDIDSMSLLVGAIGTNPVITGLIGITLAGVAGQVIWFIHRRKKSENS